MRTVILAAALIAGTAFPAWAEVWQGDAFIVKRTTTCTTNNWEVGDFFRTVLRPANVGTNDTSSRLTLIGSRNAQRFFMVDQELAGTGTYTGIFITSMAGFISWPDGTFAAAKVKPAPTPTTQTLSLNIRLDKFSGLAGCTVTLQGSLNLRP
jgi:hypothetical protein